LQGFFVVDVRNQRTINFLGLAQVIEESDPKAKDRAAEIRARIGKTEHDT